MIKIKKMFSKAVFTQHSRPLTHGEKALAYSVFGQSLNTDAIKIIAHRLVLRHYAVSPNGSIYFNTQDWREDFAQESIEIQSWLIHELTHVWQIQQGISVVRKALFDRRYHYVLEVGKSFLHYGIEQQAQMVQDYFLRAKRGQDCHAFRQCIPFLNESNVAGTVGGVKHK